MPISITDYADALVALNSQLQAGLGVFGIDVPITEKQIRLYSQQVLLYKCLAVGLLFAWSCVLDNSLACLVTLAEITQAVAFMVLLLRVVKQRSVAGISKKMLALHVVATACRSQSTLFFHGYLPYFGWGAALFPVFDLGVAAVAVYLLVLCSKFKHTYSSEADSCWVFWILPLALAIAYFSHPSANSNAYADTMWAASMWIDAFSMLPQIWMLRGSSNFESVTSHFVALTFAARLMGLIYWFESYELLKLQRYEWGVGLITWNYPGYFVVAASALQVLSVGDFMYYYIAKAAERSGSSMLATSGRLEL
mmetsp:Transcript_39077/g.93773  ORF Transcript_39077/g.93773 Transcript_39077/m.93773 type:complete len:309 (-) Transcript_39077:35-961(-)